MDDSNSKNDGTPAASRFAGKVAVVTGAAGGFGRAIARRLAEEGAAVALADIDSAKGKRTTTQLARRGARVLFETVDVSRGDDVKRLMERTCGAFGGIDILVNNAGYCHRARPLWKLAEADYDRVFEVNTKSVYLGVVHGVPRLLERGGGVIVNTASIGAVRPRPLITAYNATKGAVITLTRGLATELAPHGIRVNAVNPVAADTDFMKGPSGGRKLDDAGRDVLQKTIPLGRLAEPADVAAAVAYLASDDAAFLTGVCLDIDGGRSIG
ncbi:MAG: SDR family oxidoreductase [Acidobacteria bacterium]|nr:SDR family oxidoreductase [Acidobacteriota bacterium]